MNNLKRLLIPVSCIVSVCLFTAAFCCADEEEDKEKESKYTVGGYRHGLSFFDRMHYKEAEPLVEGELDFKHYHRYEETVSFLENWAGEYENILDLYVSGESFEGRPIYQVTLTNKDTGKDSEKPAMAIDANRHSGEVTSAVSALWLLNYLLENYGKDEAITEIVDTKTIYFRINNNPDGSEMYLNTVQFNRSSVRPHDGDRDGLLDEDSFEDLDGDGFVRQMRVKVEPDSGNYVLDPRDTSGRLMKRVLDNHGDWKIYSEGIDNDGDGDYNEDSIGGLDLHRNYPENWRPEPGQVATESGRTQWGAGEYPLSEPEIRSFVLFLLKHPNISIVNSMDTSVPMHLRGPSTSDSEDRMYPSDLKWFRYFDEEGMKITGYPWAGDTYNNYFTRRKTNPVTGDPTKPTPLFGHGPDFGYWYYGSIWYGDELWCTGAVKDYNGDGFYDEYDALCWNDEALDGREFKVWTKYDHPQLGEVEIGGFNPKFFRQNPPVEYLEEWAVKQAKHNLFLLRHLPQIEIEKIDVKKKRDEYELSVTFTNVGELPTALEQAKLVKIVREDCVRLEFDKELTHDVHNPKVEIVSPETHDKVIYAGWTDGGNSKTVKFRVKLNGIDSAKCTVHVLSTRGGHKTEEVTIGE